MGTIRDAARNLDRQHWFLLVILGVAGFFEGYDISILSLALPQIIDDFEVSRGEMAGWLLVIHLGALPAIFLSRRADRIGRRRTLFVSIVGYTTLSGLTFFAHSLPVFVFLQFWARFFLLTEAAVAHAMIAEELPAENRGFGFGFVAMLTALGVGTAAIINGLVIAPNDLDWRWLYLVGVPPLLAVTWMRRNLPESRKFEAARDSGYLTTDWRLIFRPPHLRWLVLVCVVAFLADLTKLPQEFAIEFLQEDRGVSESLSNLLLVAAGLPTIFLLSWGGALSDRLGRKVVGCLFAAIGVAGGLGLFNASVGIVGIALFMMLTLAGSATAWPTISAFTAELFPTTLRAEAAAWAAVARVGGQAVSFGLGFVLLEIAGLSLSATATILISSWVVMIAVVWFFFPETSGKELDDRVMLGVDTGPGHDSTSRPGAGDYAAHVGGSPHDPPASPSQGY